MRNGFLIILLAFYVYGCKYNKNNSIIQICVTHFCIINGTHYVENGEIYDLTGRRIESQPAKKGIYVKNGKKFIVK